MRKGRAGWRAEVHKQAAALEVDLPEESYKRAAAWTADSMAGHMPEAAWTADLPGGHMLEAAMEVVMEDLMEGRMRAAAAREDSAMSMRAAAASAAAVDKQACKRAPAQSPFQ